MKRILLALLLSTVALPAFAADNLSVTPGAGASIRMRDTTGAGGPLSSYVILGDLTGASILGTAGVANANILTVQGIASMTPLLVTATASGGFFTVRNVGNTGNTIDFPSTQNVATPQAALLVGAEFNTSPTAITSGNSSPLQLDTNGNLLVNVKAGGGAGGTSSSFGSAFPGTGTAIGAKNGANMVNLTADASNNLNVNVATANSNGAKTSVNSSPVVIATDQATFPVSPYTINNVSSQGHICGNAARVHITTNTDTQIVAQSGTTTIYICDYEFQLTGVGAFFLEKATSGTCATLTQVGPLWTGLTGTPIGKAAGNAFYRGVNTGASSQLCANTTGLSSTSLDLVVYYDQY